MHELLPISALLPGQRAEVRQVVGRPEQTRRLEELGLRAGASLELVQSGSPCIIRVAGTKLCLRDGESCSVLVAARMSA
jgi:Fe2+ transport system protein FeoA